MPNHKIGSLFDGSGGFPLAGALCEIEPKWAAEVEPYPIAVTTSRFKNVLHLGDVSKIDGGKIEPVDVACFGSPCQDLSVAGQRAGLKHESNGDDETTRSGLFMDAIRIVKEMWEESHGVYPRIVIWENVPGAVSSRRGEDFRTVLGEFIKIVDPSAVMPPVPKGGWAYADSYRGENWSLAYRVFDAQYIRTAQRRRRIYLVFCLTDGRAEEILFKRDGLRGHSEKSQPQRETVAGDVGKSIEATDCERVCVGWPLGFRPENVKCHEERSSTLCNGTRLGFTCGIIERRSLLFENHSQDSRYKGPLDVCPMLPAQLGTGGNNTPFVVEEGGVYSIDGDKIGKAERNGGSGFGVRDDGKIYTLTAKDAGRHSIAYGLDRASYNQGKNAQFDFSVLQQQQPTMTAKGPGAVSYCIGNGQVDDASCPDQELSKTLNCMHDPMAVMTVNESSEPQYIVRRLTPTECARLQGFPDWWGIPDYKDSFTDEEYNFWLNVRNTHAEINGKAVKEYTKEQMLKWYNKLHTDSAEYKMWGNGIALPCALFVMQGVKDALESDDLRKEK